MAFKFLAHLEGFASPTATQTRITNRQVSMKKSNGMGITGGHGIRTGFMDIERFRQKDMLDNRS
jgi:hypothetical protein